MLLQHGDLSSIINEKGCLAAGEEWLEKNLLVVAGVAVGIAFLQVCTSFYFFYTFLRDHDKGKTTVHCPLTSTFCRFWVYASRKISERIFSRKWQNGTDTAGPRLLCNPSDGRPRLKEGLILHRSQIKKQILVVLAVIGGRVPLHFCTNKYSLSHKCRQDIIRNNS